MLGLGSYIPSSSFDVIVSVNMVHSVTAGIVQLFTLPILFIIAPASHFWQEVVVSYITLYIIGTFIVSIMVFSKIVTDPKTPVMTKVRYSMNLIILFF